MQVGDLQWNLKQQQEAERLFVRFSVEARKDEAASLEAGRPVFKDVEYIEIMVPGDRQNIIHRPVRETDKEKFSKAYAAWKQGLAEPSQGTPLSQWPQVTRAQVEELAFYGIRTVEHLAGVSFANAQKLGTVQRHIKAAQDWLAAAKDSAHVAQLRAENEALRNEMEVLKEQMAGVLAKARESAGDESKAKGKR